MNNLKTLIETLDKRQYEVVDSPNQVGRFALRSCLTPSFRHNISSNFVLN